jgi:hypothetical protein
VSRYKPPETSGIDQVCQNQISTHLCCDTFGQMSSIYLRFGSLTLALMSIVCGGAAQQSPPAASVPGSMAGTPEYVVLDICAPRSCLPYLLGDGGVVAGNDFAIYPDKGYVDIFQTVGTHLFPYGINRAGIIAGTTGRFNQSAPFPPLGPFGQWMGNAAVFLPSVGELLILDPIFGWDRGIATYVNNQNEVVGYSAGRPITDLIPSVSLTEVYALTDSHVVIGRDNIGPLIYLPGYPAVRWLGPKYQRGYFNSAGQVLTTHPYLGRLFTPGVGYSDQQSCDGFEVAGFNESGEFVGNLSASPSGSSYAPSYYRQDKGLVPLAQLVSPMTGWTVERAVAINNPGQILVYGSKEGRSTALLLTPSADAKRESTLPTK